MKYVAKKVTLIRQPSVKDEETLIQEVLVEVGIEGQKFNGFTVNKHVKVEYSSDTKACDIKSLVEELASEEALKEYTEI